MLALATCAAASPLSYIGDVPRTVRWSLPADVVAQLNAIVEMR